MCPTQWNKHLTNEGTIKHWLKCYVSLSCCQKQWPQHTLPQGVRCCCSLGQSCREPDGAPIQPWTCVALLPISFSGRAVVCSRHMVINTRMSNSPCGGSFWGSREGWQGYASCWHCGFLLEWSVCVTMAWEVSSNGLSRNQQSILHFHLWMRDRFPS